MLDCNAVTQCKRCPLIEAFVFCTFFLPVCV